MVCLGLKDNEFPVVDLALDLDFDFVDYGHRPIADTVVFPYPNSDFCHSSAHDFFLDYNWNIGLGCKSGYDSVLDLCCLGSKSGFYLDCRNDFDLGDVGSFLNYRSVHNDPACSSVDDPEGAVDLIVGFCLSYMDDFVFLEGPVWVGKFGECSYSRNH